MNTFSLALDIIQHLTFSLPSITRNVVMKTRIILLKAYYYLKLKYIFINIREHKSYLLKQVKEIRC